MPYDLLWRAIEYEIMQKCVDEGVGILCYSSLAQGLLTGKFSSLDEVPEGQARTRLFSETQPQARHGEEGCESETFAALERIRRICADIGQPMSQVALTWLLHQPGVTSVIAGARDPNQIEQTAQAVDLQLSSETISQLNEATEQVKQIIGHNPDMWQSESRIR